MHFTHHYNTIIPVLAFLLFDLMCYLVWRIIRPVSKPKFKLDRTKIAFDKLKRAERLRDYQEAV